eukprot:scaffold38990_cov26-Tisochrysis_lutea.AAC.3
MTSKSTEELRGKGAPAVGGLLRARHGCPQQLEPQPAVAGEAHLGEGARLSAKHFPLLPENGIAAHRRGNIDGVRGRAGGQTELHRPVARLGLAELDELSFEPPAQLTDGHVLVAQQLNHKSADAARASFSGAVRSARGRPLGAVVVGRACGPIALGPLRNRLLRAAAARERRRQVCRHAPQDAAARKADANGAAGGGRGDKRWCRDCERRRRRGGPWRRGCWPWRLAAVVDKGRRRELPRAGPLGGGEGTMHWRALA